jgi:hypothetical protein
MSGLLSGHIITFSRIYVLIRDLKTNSQNTYAKSCSSFIRRQKLFCELLQRHGSNYSFKYLLCLRFVKKCEQVEPGVYLESQQETDTCGKKFFSTTGGGVR